MRTHVGLLNNADDCNDFAVCFEIKPYFLEGQENEKADFKISLFDLAFLKVTSYVSDMDFERQGK